MRKNNSSNIEQKVLELTNKFERSEHFHSAISATIDYDSTHINSAYVAHLYQQGKFPQQNQNVHSAKALENSHSNIYEHTDLNSAYAFHIHLQEIDLERMKHNLFKYIHSAKKMDEIHKVLYVTYNQIYTYQNQQNIDKEYVMEHIYSTYSLMERFLDDESNNNLSTSSTLDIKQCYEATLNNIIAIKSHIKSIQFSEKQVLNIAATLEILERTVSSEELKDLFFALRILLIILLNNR